MVEVLITENAGKFFEEAVPSFKIISNDKNYDVRKAFYSTMFILLKSLNILFLRKFEHLIVIFIMNGLSDEKSDISQSCFDYLEQAGEYRKVKFKINKTNPLAISNRIRRNRQRIKLDNKIN